MKFFKTSCFLILVNLTFMFQTSSSLKLFHRFKSVCSNILVGSTLIGGSYASIASASDSNIPSIANIQVSYNNNEKAPINSYLGKKGTLIFNFGSQCDLPADGEPQCKDLVNLYKKHKDEGFQVIAFLTDQFRDQSMLGE